MRPQNPSIEIQEFSTLNNYAKLERLVKFALLAPSTHNIQPWLFKIQDNSILILRNVERQLSQADPHNRQIFISIGAAIQNIITASAYFGYKATIEFGEKDVIAKITLEECPPKIELREIMQALLNRRCDRNAYLDTAIPSEFLDWILQNSEEIEVNLISDSEKKTNISKVVGASLKTALDDPNFRKELSKWVRPSLSKYKDGMPGYTLGMPILLSFIFPLLLKIVKLGGAQQKQVGGILAQTPMFVVLSTPQDDVTSWIKVGLFFEKIFIKATALGLSISVQGAPIEIKEYYKDLQKILSSNSRPQMFFRIGYPKKINNSQFSPRLSLEDVITP